MVFPNGIRSQDPLTGQPKVWSSVLQSSTAGPYAVNENELLKEALTSVRARPEIDEQLAVLQEPPQLEHLLDEQRGVIKMNLAEQLERTRQLGVRLHELLVSEIASDPGRHAAFLELSEAADGLRDVSQALFDVSLEPPGGVGQDTDVRVLLTAAWERRNAAAHLSSARTSPAVDWGRQAQVGNRASPPKWPDPPQAAVVEEIVNVTHELLQIQAILERQMTEQIDQASERPDFRNLETEWKAARADLGSTAESTIHGLVLTVLNSAVAAHFALSMQIRSLKGLRETITNEKVVITPSFERLESMIDRHGEGSFGIAGPRGVGKSALIKFFTTSDTHTMALGESTPQPPERSRLGASVAAPVAYDAREFVLHLHAEVCRALLGPNADRMLEIEVEKTPRRATSVLTAVSVASTGVVCLAGGAILVAVAAQRLSAPDDAWTYAGLAITAIAVGLLVFLLLGTVWLAVPGRRTRFLTRDPIDATTAQDWRYYKTVGKVSWGWPILALTAAIGLSLFPVSGGLGRGTWMLLGGTAAVVLGGTLLSPGRKHYALVLRNIWHLPPTSAAEITTYSRKAGLHELALDQLRQIRYQQTLSNEHSMTLRLGGARQLPVGVDVGSKQGTTLAERTKTYPEIVSGLRAFLETVSQRHQLIIAVDELDKLRSAEDVENFLNDIKGVFGASRCFFLVSVSEEAAASFERRGIPFRDVFDSCFDDVLTLQRLGLDTGRKILYGLLLGWREPFVALCYVLSGGLPRELQRSARQLVGKHGEKSTIDLLQAVPELMRHEAAARLGAVRHGLLREACGPASLALVSRIELIDPAGASADQFREWYKELAEWCLQQFAGLRNSDGSSMPATTRMGCELAAFMLFAATVMDFFGSTLTADRLQQAAKPEAGGKSLAKLADARHALSLSPWTSVGCLTSFRDAWGL
ncbi:hypothetical protein [Streptomyces sp. NPDC085540]|uniref:hypothetical protein n=1 Tax=Streptomyces sp. NPDC085540 TaxID=3365730 RepID=UPI0037D90ECF